MKKVVVYDCDGVIFESTKAVCAYYDHVFDKFGVEKLDWNDSEILRTAMMGSNDQIIKTFVKDEDTVKEILEFAKNLNFKLFTPLMEPHEAIEETLQKLQKSNYELAIFTNRGISLPYLMEYFGLHKYFSYTITCFDVANPKPDPEGLYKIMDRYKAVKEDLIFIGDSMTDYLAAKSANVDFLAYKNTLEESTVIDHHGEVFNYLGG